MDEKKKKMLLILGGGVGLIILIIVIVCIIFLFQDHTLSYAQMEATMKQAAQNYYSEHGDGLPKEDGEETRLDASTLVSEELMDSFAKMTGKEDTNCSGYIDVMNVRGGYVYTPHLTCGDDYHTELLSEHLIATVGQLEDDQSGLYEMNGEYVFRGEYPRNIVSFADHTWRIVKIDSNGEIVLLLADEKLDRYPWDDRYNLSDDGNTGITNYSMSRIRSTVSTFLKEEIDDDSKTYLATYDLCVGSRNKDVVTSDGTEECSELFEDQVIGLLPAYDSVNASLDANCTPSSYTCQNYNYLARIFDRGWWTLTTNNKSTYRAYYVEKGILLPEDASKEFEVRPVVHLHKNVVFQGGIGKGADPYVVGTVEKK